MRVLFIAGRELEYERNEVLLRACQRFSDVTVIGSTHKPGSLIFNSFKVTVEALYHLRHDSGYDLIVVGFYGYLIARLLVPLVHTPILFDAFVSNYDTLCFDRQDFSPNSLLGKFAFWLDKSTCQAAHLVLLDTPQHQTYFVNTFGLPPTRFRTVPVGCNEDIFKFHTPLEADNHVRILYYCTYLPLHGAATVVQAANLVRNLPVRFRLIGTGPLFTEVHRLAQRLQLTNIEFQPPVSREILAKEIAEADICLGGHFGVSEKAARVVPGKIYQMLAVGRPIIAADTAANQDLLVDGVHAMLVAPGDPQSLATAIYQLYEQPALRTTLGLAGYARYCTCASEAIITSAAYQAAISTQRHSQG